MSKKILEALRDSEVRDEIIKLYCQLHKDSFKDGGMSGWRWKVIVSENGEVDYMYGNNYSTRMDVYNGTSIEVASIDSMVEVWSADFGEIEDTVDDFQDFKDWIMIQYCIDEEDEDANYKIEEYLTWLEYYEYNPSSFAKLENDTWEKYSEIYAYDEIVDIIYNRIEELEYYS